MVVPGEDGTVAHAELSFRGAVIMLGTARDDELRIKSPHDLGAVSGDNYVYVGNVDAHSERARAAGPKSCEVPRTRTMARANIPPAITRVTCGGSVPTGKGGGVMADESIVRRLRKICLALPEATERPFGGHTDPTWRVREKIFVMYSDNHGDGMVSLQCKGPPGASRLPDTRLRKPAAAPRDV